jgi:BirA family transcriptional regulator, biotin operon repressor / biotin---[acetyl-CoA-carboxylase] ligase
LTYKGNYCIVVNGDDMNTKEKVYELLVESADPISGETIASELHVSRAAIWKAINSLKEDGHSIEGIPKKGYFLLKNSDEFNKEAILNFLNDSNKSKVIVLDTVDSTNTYAKKLAEEGCLEWTIVLSKSQIKGRGRFGRNFYSPKGGCYCSFVLKPVTSIQDTLRVTMITAIAICHVVEKLCSKRLNIKWVNDLYYNDKKVCGILTEASLNFETNLLNYLVIGFGINLNLDSIPSDLENIITDINYTGDKNKFVAAIINEFNICLNLSMQDIVKEYRNRNLLLNKQVIVSGGESGEAKVLDITNEGNLLVRFNDNREVILVSGEVSLKEIENE